MIALQGEFCVLVHHDHCKSQKSHVVVLVFKKMPCDFKSLLVGEFLTF